MPSFTAYATLSPWQGRLCSETFPFTQLFMVTNSVSQIIFSIATNDPVAIQTWNSENFSRAAEVAMQ